MQIAINITHEFGDVTAFAAFAEKLKALFSEYAPVATVCSAAPVIALADGPGAEPPRAMPDRTAAEQTVAIEIPDAVTPPTTADSPASPKASVPASGARRGRKPKADKIADIMPAAYLPAAGTFGGPAVASPPATAPDAPAAVIPAAAGADDLRADKAFVLEWIGRVPNGHAKFAAILGPHLDKPNGKSRLQDLDAATRAKIIAAMKAEAA